MTANESINFQRLTVLIYDVSRDVLDEMLKKKLDERKMDLTSYLQEQKHKLYHLFQRGKCCQCETFHRINPSYIYDTQWKMMYDAKGPKCKVKRCACQYTPKTGVSSSCFDVSLLTILLLNSECLNIDIGEKAHIKRIRMYRNELVAHNTCTKIPNDKFNVVWDDLAVSVLQLASGCSQKHYTRTRSKIETTKEEGLIKNPDTILNLFYKAVCDFTATKLDDERVFRSSIAATGLEESMRRLEEILKRNISDASQAQAAASLSQPQGAACRHEDKHQHHGDTQQTVSIKATSHLEEIRRRVSHEDLRENLYDMDPVPIIECLYSENYFSAQERQSLLSTYPRRTRCNALLDKILSKDDTVILAFIDALRIKEETIVANYILGYEYKDDLQIKLKWDLPVNFKLGMETKLIMKMEIENQPAMQNEVLRILREDDDAINELVSKFTKMTICDVREGSIVIRLNPGSFGTLEQLRAAYLNGDLRKLVQNILSKAGILEQMKKDDISVIVTIAATDEAKATAEGEIPVNTRGRTFYEVNRQYILEELSPKPVVALLLERRVLDEKDANAIFRSENLSRYSQAAKLIDILESKGSNTICHFKQCLSLSYQEYILEQATAIFDDEEESPQIPQIEVTMDTTTKESKGGFFTDRDENDVTAQTKAENKISKGAYIKHVTEKTPEEVFNRDEDWAVSYRDIQAVGSKTLCDSIGLIEISGQGAKYGTGFRVGSNYVMTAYHTFKDKIGLLRTSVCDKIGQVLGKCQNKQRILACLSDSLELTMPSSFDNQSISKYCMMYFEKRMPEINFPELLNELRALGDQDIVHQTQMLLKTNWEQSISISFSKLDDSDGASCCIFDSHIPYADPDNDVLILKLVVRDDILKPKALQLVRNQEIPEIHIAGYPKDTRRRLKVDLRCPVYTDNALLEQDIENAISWWSKTYSSEKKIDFHHEYKECRSSFNTANGRSIIHASRSFTNGASGSPMFFIDGLTDTPMVTMMYLRGYPAFYYEANSSYAKTDIHLQKYTNEHVPYKNLFAAGITMERVHHLLLYQHKQDLAKDIFGNP